MKFPLVITLCLLFLIGQVWSAAYLIPPHNNPAYQGKCYTEELNLGVMEVGQCVKIPNECLQATCLSNFYISVVGCGVVAAEPPCYVVPGDRSLLYPDCCETVHCPENNQI